MSAQIITELNVAQLQKLQSEMTTQLLIIKFGAEWCGPCKKIAPAFHTFIKNAPSNILFADIDVDDNIDLYMTLKKHKMVTGIPVFFAYHGQSTREKWYIPDDSIIGADDKQVADFFTRCVNKANSYSNVPVGGYTYFS